MPAIGHRLALDSAEVYASCLYKMQVFGCLAVVGRGVCPVLAGLAKCRWHMECNGGNQD